MKRPQLSPLLYEYYVKYEALRLQASEPILNQRKSTKQLFDALRKKLRRI